MVPVGFLGVHSLNLRRRDREGLKVLRLGSLVSNLLVDNYHSWTFNFVGKVV